jgi:hypothetical protein
MNLEKFLAEPKRRKVYRVAIGYIVAGWALAQGNVEHVLEGSVRRDGNRVRDTVELIDALG